MPLMIGTTGATVLLIAYMVFAGVLGIAAGGLSCLVLRRPWGLKAAAIDVAVAILAMIVAEEVEMKIDIPRGNWDPHSTLNFTIAAASAGARHLFRLGRRSPS
jgi:hypothetical protein